MSKKRRHLQPALPPRGPRLEEVLARANALHESGDLEGALAVLDEAPIHLQHRLEVLLFRAMLYGLLNDPAAALSVLEDAVQAYPDEPHVAFLLADLYYQMNELGHAARMIHKAMRHPDRLKPDETRSQARQLLEAVEREVADASATLGVPAETVVRAFYVHEQGLRLNRQGRYREAIPLFRQFAEMIPTAPIGRINEALCHFFNGDVERAIRMDEETLAEYGDHPQTLAHLVRFHMALDERERAQEYAVRLKQLPLDDDPPLLLSRIEALGVMEDDEALFAIYRHYQKRLDELDWQAYLILGSAAANLGKPGIARHLWQRALTEGVPPEIVWPLLDALREKAPGPVLASRYPTVYVAGLVPFHALEELFDFMEAMSDVDVGEREEFWRFDQFVARTPNIVRVASKVLWEDNPEAGVHLLGMIGNADAVAELERFAFGQAGPLHLRALAAETLNRLGRLDLSQPVTLWDEKAQEWRVVYLERWTVVSDDEIPSPVYRPDVKAHIDAGAAALAEGRLEDAERELRAALARDPRATIAHHNLAVVLMRSGNAEAALAQLHKALEIDPHYIFARCTLANYYISEGDVTTALEVLSPIRTLRRIRVSDWSYYERTTAWLEATEGRYDEARQRLLRVLQVAPDAPGVRERLEEIEGLAFAHSPFWEEMRARTRRRQEARRQQPLARDAGLADCLSRLLKEALIGTARCMPDPRPYNVRKEVLIRDLVGVLTDPSNLDRLVQDLLREEVAALRDVLEAGGVMPLETFAERYDDDIDESPYWQYHEPETILGYLRMIGLLSVGTVDGQLSVLIPRELRALLPSALDNWTDPEEEFEEEEE